MKRIIALVFTALILCTGAFSAFAAGGIFAAFDLIKEWSKAEEYPDYFCGMWMKEDDHVIFGVVGGEEGEEGRKEILSRVDPSAVRFVEQKYSYNELLALQKELDTHLSEELGFLSTVLNVIGNRVDLGLLDVKEGDPLLAEFVAETSDRYGDRVAFEYHDEIYYIADGLPSDDGMTVGAFEEGEEKPNPSVTVILFAFFFCLAGLVVFFLQKGRRAALADGGTVSSAPVTVKTVKQALREGPCPSGMLDQKVFSAVKKARKP